MNWTWRPRMQRRRGMARNMWEILVTGIAAALFVWQVELNVEVFLGRPTVFTVTIDPDPIFRLPPLTICPHPVFEPAKLRRLGVNVSGNYVRVEEALLHLSGLNGSLSTAQLWREAQWRLGQIVKMVMFKNISVIYKRDATEAPHWRRSYSPLGPCFTFVPPAGETNVKIAIHSIPYVEPCVWVDGEEQLVKYNGLSSQCDNVEKKCNSTCGFENFVLHRRSALKAAFVYFHATSDYEALTKENVHEFSNRLFKGNYILKYLESIPNLRCQTQQIESLMIKGECVPSTYDHSECYQRHQRSKALRNLGCLPALPSTFQDSISKTCSSPSLIQELFELDKQLERCPHSCFQRRWKHVISEAWGPEFMVVLEASTTDLRQEKELETYPLAQLFSDIGGSLGLFLGVSIFHVWGFGVQIVFARQNGDLSHAGKLLKYVGMLAACLATCVHCLQEFKIFMSQPVLTSVSLRVPSDEAEDLTIALARRLASRALDCRPQEAPLADCQIQCLLEGATKEVMSAIPFIDVDDLPPCKSLGFVIPFREYVIPSETLMVASDSKLLHSCAKSCETLHRTNKSRSFPKSIHVNQHYRSYDIVRLICSLGGIVGLYLGYSAFQAVDLCGPIWCAGRGLKSYSVHIRRFLKFCIFLFGLVVAFLRSYRFFVQHQVSTSIIPTHSVPQVVTVCRWPPMSFLRLASYLGSNITLESILEKPLEQRQESVLRLLDSLEGNWSSSLDDVWRAAAWNITDVIGGYSIRFSEGYYFDSICDSDSDCDDVWTPVATPLNRCFSMNTTFENKQFSEMLLQFSDDLEKKDVYGHKPQVFFLLHPSGIPPLLTDMVAKHPAMSVTASVFSATYEPLEKNRMGNHNPDLNYESCVQRCVGDGLGNAFKCRLPYMDWRPDLPLCNQTQYSSIPRHFKGLENIGERLQDLKSNAEAPQALLSLEDECFISCRHLRKTFYTLKTDRLPSLYPSLTVRPQAETLRTRETDTYTFAQFISDLGGIAGASVGFSLLRLLKDLLPRTKTT